MNITDEKLEQMLRSQVWIEPGAEFTDRVIRRLPAFAPAPRRSRWNEWALMAVPVGVIALLLLQYGRPISDLAMGLLRDIGFWLGTTTGVPAFAAYPIILLGLVAPLLAGAVASCAVTGRCKISRALTS